MRLNSVDEVFDLMATRADGSYGLAGVTQLEHALQSAALAVERDLGDALVIAALLHDIGHLAVAKDVSLADQGIDDRHEDAGPAMLADVFGPEVTEPIRLHVDAKRYLCAVEADYFGRLAPDSVRSLKLQGGPMSADEVAAFAGNPAIKAAADLRRIDDDAKTPGLDVPGLEAYRSMAEGLAKPAI